jgi:glycosyltransferase involved in cell wall biosynthesis
MAAGTAVLVSRGSSLDEVAAGAGLAVDPLVVESIAAGMRRLTAEPGLREELAGRGRLRSAELDWRRTAEETRAVFAAVAAGRFPAREGLC